MSRSSGPGGQHAQKSSTRVEALLDVEASTALTEIQKQRVVARAGTVAARSRAGRAKPGPEPRARSRAARRETPRRTGSSASTRSDASGQGCDASAGSTESAGAPGRRRSEGRRAANRLAGGGRAPARIAASRAPTRADTPPRQPRARSPRGGADHDGALGRGRRPHEHPPRRGARGRLLLLLPRGADRRGSRLHRAGVRLLRRAGAARADAGRDRGRLPRPLRPRAGDDARRRDRPGGDARDERRAGGRARHGRRDARGLRGARRARAAPRSAVARARSSKS